MIPPIMQLSAARDTPALQTNHNILYAESADNGQGWSSQNGGAYTLPITKPQAQVIADIPEQSTLINQTSMAVDSQDRPLVATWCAPGAAEGDHTRQYMLHYFNGDEWQASQITDLPPEGKQSDSTVRDLGRPIVLVDDEDRVLVVMRYKEAGDRIVVAVSEDREEWDFLTLADTEMGLWEPTYDAVLWERENKLHLFYQTMGIGQETSPVAVLEWDAKAYFAAIPEPGSAGLLLPLAFGPSPSWQWLPAADLSHLRRDPRQGCAAMAAIAFDCAGLKVEALPGGESHVCTRNAAKT